MTAKQLQTFILWMRREKITASTLKVGGVELDGFRDLKLAAEMPQAKIDPPQSWQERWGGDLLKHKAVDGSDVPPESMED